MTKDEYRTALREIVSDGLGFDAIRDLSEILATYDANMLAVVKEMKAERKAIKKICEGDASSKDKMQAVVAMMK